MNIIKPRHVLIWGTVAGVTVAMPLYLGRPADAILAVIFGTVWAIAASTIHHLRDLELERIELETAEQARADRLAGDFRIPRPPAIRAFDDGDLDDDTSDLDDDQADQPPGRGFWRRTLHTCARSAGVVWRALAPQLTVLQPMLVDEQREPGRHRAPDEPDRPSGDDYRDGRHTAPDPDELAALIPVAAITAHPHHEVPAAHLPLAKEHDEWRFSTDDYTKAFASFFADMEANSVRA